MNEKLNKALLELFVDRYTCIYCDEEIKPVRYGLCAECLEKAPFIGESKCLYCGRKTNSETQYCENCIREKRFFDKNCAPFEYKGLIKTLLLGFKFHNKRFLAKYFAKAMADVYLSEDYDCDLIVAAPVSAKTLGERGYNQADLLARELSENLKIPYFPSLLQKVKDTPQQSSLKRKERLVNLTNAFVVSDKAQAQDKSILLVDDILTTGTTLNECAKALKKCGAKRIEGLTLAITPIKIVAERKEPSEAEYEE